MRDHLCARAWAILKKADKISFALFLSINLGCYTSNRTSQDVEVDVSDAPTYETWILTLGNDLNDGINSVVESRDGGFILAGRTGPWGVDEDILIIKVDSNGHIIWQKTIGGPSDELTFKVIENVNNEIIVGASTWSYGFGSKDAWVLKLDSNGELIWQKTYGGDDFDGLFSLIECSDGHIVIAGTTGSFGENNGNIWVMKIDNALDFGKPHLPPVILNPRPGHRRTPAALLTGLSAVNQPLLHPSYDTRILTYQISKPVHGSEEVTG